MDGAAYGLRYDVLFVRMAQLDLNKKQHEAMFQDIRHMEREALRAMRESN